MSVYFITGNEDKYKEVISILPEVEWLNIDLPEIQHINSREVVKAKLQEAFKYRDGEFIVEDTSLYLDCLGGLPGPLIKWFLKAIGCEGIYQVAEKMGSMKAEAKTIIGYAKSPDDIHFFEGSILGTIVSPRGDKGFGWDSIFQPVGFDKTFAEMEAKEKNQVSMRKKALGKLKEFLEV